MIAPPWERERTRVVARDDLGACAALYEQHVDRLYSYALHCLHDGGAAEEVVSETFRRALENRARDEWRGGPYAAWLFCTALTAV